MTAATVALALALGFAAGALSGLFGVGGGILFVPTLAIVLDLSQLSAQATSLAAMIPVVAVGAWRQQQQGNVDWHAAAFVGAASAAGVAGGAVLADALPEDVLRYLFAALLVIVAARLSWSARVSGS
jgi:uncharacterized membrane protein YfcA